MRTTDTGSSRGRADRRPPGWRTRAGRVALAYGIAACLGLAVLALVRDRTALTYTLGLAAFWWLVPALPLLVVALAARRLVAAVVVLVPALVVGMLMVPDHPRWRGEGGGHRDLRVATWNISAGAPVDDVFALVRRRSPSVLVLQEVRPDAHQQLARLASTYPYSSYAPVELPPQGQGDGAVVFSRYPIIAVSHVSGMPASSRPLDEVTLAVGKHRVVVFSLHLASPCVGCPPGSTFNPTGGPGESARVRVREARRVAALVRPSVRRGDAVVVAGDINSSDLNQPLGILKGAGLTDAFRAVSWGPGLTRGSRPGIARVDVVLVAGLRPVAAFVPGPGASTHAPVVADLVWT